MTPASGVYFRSRIIHGDLYAADQGLSDQITPTGTWVPFLKLALVALASLGELERSMRPLYQGHPKIAQGMKAIGRDLDFAKYLRNVFAGHINQDLIEKAYEWRPELRALPEKRTMDATAILNVFVLETAINTYVAADGSHGMFSSETDLVYPPDMERFRKWLTEAVRSAIGLTDLLGAATAPSVEPLGEKSQMLGAFIKAGETDFTRIRKGR